MTAPSLTSVPVWANFEKRIFGILELALTLLEDGDGTVGELELNERLADHISAANFQLRQAGEGGLDFLPSYDGHQYPDETVPLGEANRKRPDFTWSWQDDSGLTHDEATREFAVECKRLGDMAGSEFNHRYVDEGILRFVNSSHEYGRRGGRGAMVGYVQVLGKPAILVTVQTRAASHQLSPLSPDGELDVRIARLTQQLDRTFGESPFELVHFWVDVARSPDSLTTGRQGETDLIATAD